MRILLLFAFLILSNNVFCCDCGLQPDFKTKDDLKRYDFIAFLEITQAKIPQTNNGKAKLGDSFKIRIIELFKGQPDSVIYDDAPFDDCDFSPSVGQQFLLFGNRSKMKTYIEPCSHTTLYRDFDGSYRWIFNTEFETLELLRNIYEHPQVVKLRKKIFFTNGQIQATQSFKNGELDGIRKIYYPNGKLLLIEDYKRGVHKSFQKIYTESGQLWKCTMYQNGFVNIITDYEDTAFASKNIKWEAKDELIRRYSYRLKVSDLERSPYREMYQHMVDSLRKAASIIRISSMQVINSTVKSYRNYNNKGTINTERYLYYDKKFEERCYYNDDGKLRTYSKKDGITNIETEYDYRPDGTKREFVMKCKDCETMFQLINRNIPLVAKAYFPD